VVSFGNTIFARITETTVATEEITKESELKEESDNLFHGSLLEDIHISNPIDKNTMVVANENWSTFETRDFSFNYSTSWLINERVLSFNDNLRVELINYDPNTVTEQQNTNPFFKIEIVQLDNPSNLSLKEWLDDFIQSQDYPLEILEERYITVDGRESIYQEKRNLAFDFIYPTVYIKEGLYIYLINVGSDKAFKPVFEEVLSSFKFKDD